MPGTPPTSPVFQIPRYADSDTADFAGQVNAVTDQVDLAIGSRTENLTIRNANYTAAAGDAVVATAAISVGLPSAPLDQSSVAVIAEGGDATVNRSGTDTITQFGSSGLITLTVHQGTVARFRYHSGVWHLTQAQQWGGGDVSGLFSNLSVQKFNGQVLPTGQGISGQFLQTDGAGHLTWGSASPGSSSLAARAYRNAALALVQNVWTKVAVDTVSFDTSSAISVVNGRFVAPVAGYYAVQGQVQATSANNFAPQAAIYKNGVEVAQGDFIQSTAGGETLAVNVHDVIFCNAGDYLELYALTTAAATTLVTATASNFLSAILAAGLPGAVGTTTVARAYRSATLSVPAVTNTKVPLDTISYDPGNNISTANGRYNVPATGYYQVNAEVGTFNLAAGTRVITMIYKNGSEVARAEGEVSATGQGAAPAVGDVVFCNAGDYLELWVYTGGATSISAGGVTTFLSVVQVGNSMNFTNAGGALDGTYPNPQLHTAADWLQNGAMNSGDFALSGISVNGATGAITFTAAAGVLWVKDVNGILRRVVLAANQAFTLTPPALPASGNTFAYLLRFDTNGVPTLVQTGAGVAGNVAITNATLAAASTLAAAGFLGVAAFSIYNNAGTYQLSSTTAATAGTNWLDRRPWARGFFDLITRTSNAGGGSDYSITNVTVWTPIDPSNLAMRIECSGAPLEIALSASFSDTVGFQLAPLVDGAAVVPMYDTLGTANVGSLHSWRYVPTAGSHLIQPGWENYSGGAGSVTMIARPTIVAQFWVREIPVQNANNGTA